MNTLKKHEYTSKPQRVLVIEFQPEHLDKINEFIQIELVAPGYQIGQKYPNSEVYEMQQHGKGVKAIYPGCYLAVYFFSHLPRIFERFEIFGKDELAQYLKATK